MLSTKKDGNHKLLGILKFDHNNNIFVPLFTVPMIDDDNEYDEKNNLSRLSSMSSLYDDDFELEDEEESLHGVMESAAETINEVIHKIPGKELTKPVSSVSPKSVAANDPNGISNTISNVTNSIDNVISELSIAEITEILNHGKDFLKGLSPGSKIEENEEKKEKEEQDSLLPIVSSIKVSIDKLLN